jgi:hypothetical protein
MKNKIKSLVSAVSVLALAAPALASAQFGMPGGTNLPFSSVTNIIMGVMYWLLYIIGFLGVIGFAIAGILYMTAAGDDDRMNRAKSALLYSIIGIVVAIVGLVAINFATGLLSGSSRL